MNLMSTPVLLLSAGASAPMLWQGLVTGDMPLETTMVRFAIVVVGAWLALSVIEMLIGTTAPSETAASSVTPPSPGDPPSGG